MRLASDLEREARFILEDDVFEEVKQWYLYAFEGNWDYVFFVVRRSYVLALILEEITGKKMRQDDSLSFLTDSAIPLLVDQFAAYYKENGHFPSILLCDDLMIHGRNVNSLLENLEKRLQNALNEYDPSDIMYALADAVRVHVYARSTNNLFLRDRYKVRMHFVSVVEPDFCHKFASSMSSLVLNSGIANATYVVSEPVSESSFDQKGIKDDFIKTSYQNTVQYTNVQYVRISSYIKAVATLRIVKNNRNNMYRAIPFVFLPNLAEEETRLLHRSICGFMMQSKHFTYDDKEFLDILFAKEGMRSYNELVTMILSYAILNEFNRRYNVDVSTEDMLEEIHKISLNFPKLGQYDIQDFLCRVLKHPFISDFKTIEYLILNSLSDDRGLFSVIDGAQRCSDKQIIYELEDKVYLQASCEEKEAFLLSKDPFYTSKEYSIRKVRGCGFLLRDLAQGKDIGSVSKLTSYFLQMLDAGVLSISSLAGDGTKVVGFSEFARAGEQSLLLYPLRYMEFIPFMSKLHRYCDQRGRDFGEELKLYQSSGMSDLEDGVTEKLLKLYDKLKEIGQTPNEWNNNYTSKLEWEGGNRLRQVLHLISLQEKHIENFEKYVY